MTKLELVHRGGRPAIGSSPRFLPNGGDWGDRDTFYVSFDPESENFVEVVVNAVATILNVETSALEPLQKTVDPDALERLVGHPSKVGSSDLEVTFVYQGLEITASGDGDIWLEWE